MSSAVLAAGSLIHCKIPSFLLFSAHLMHVCCLGYRYNLLGLGNNCETVIIMPSWSHDNRAVKTL